MSEVVQITTSTFGVADGSPIESLTGAGYEVRLNPFGRRLTRDEAKRVLGDPRVVGLLAGLEPLDRDVLECGNLRALVRVGSGADNVDAEAARELGITLDRTPDGPTSAVAELTIGALLATLRSIPQMNQALHAGEWDKRTGGQIEARTVHVVGFGLIGARVAELVTAFGASVLVTDPFVDPEDSPYPLVHLSEGYGRADVVTFHNSGETCLLDSTHLDLLKPGIIVLNASRGGVVSEEAVARGLDSGVIRGAWLDVFDQEPYRGPLAGRSDLVLTPHVGSYTRECRLRMERDAVQKLLDALAKESAP